MFATNATAQFPLALDTPTVGTVMSQQTMRYQLSIPSPGEITVNITGWESTLNWGTDYDRAYIYNSSEEPISIEEFGSVEDPFLAHMLANPVDIITRVGQGGEYYLDLHSGARWDELDNPIAQNFTITVTLTPTTDVHENNDTRENAAPLSIGSATEGYQWKQTPNASVWGDEDYFLFDVASPGVLTWHLSGWVATLNWSADFDRMYLYDKDGNPIGGDSLEDPYFEHMLYDDEITKERTIVAQLAGPGQYYARFHSGAGYSTTPYSLSTDFLPVNDLHEPNNSEETAAPIRIGVEHQAWQWNSVGQGITVWGDEDYYTFDVASAGDLTISIAGWISTYNWGADYDLLTLYEVSAPETNLLEDHMIGDPYSKTVALPDAGTYVLKLHAGVGFSTESYTLELDYTGDVPVDTDSDISTSEDDTETEPDTGEDTEIDTVTDTSDDTEIDTGEDTSVDTSADTGVDTGANTDEDADTNSPQGTGDFTDEDKSSSTKCSFTASGVNRSYLVQLILTAFI